MEEDISTEVKDRIREIARRDGRYRDDAYFFVVGGLDFTINRQGRGGGHVSCVELLDGIRAFALEKYGPMARTVLSHWGVSKTEDFGNIVFTLIDNEIFGKQPGDSIEDFRNVYDFETVFDKPYRI